MNIEHCLESCWLPVEPSKAGGALKERIVQIQMEYWSFITNDDVQVYQSMWSVHNPTCGHQMCLWYYRWREMRVGEMRLSFERGRMEGGRAIERRAGSSCLPLSWSITHFPHISCKCIHKVHYNQMNRVWSQICLRYYRKGVLTMWKYQKWDHGLREGPWQDTKHCLAIEFYWPL